MAFLPSPAAEGENIINREVREGACGMGYFEPVLSTADPGLGSSSGGGTCESLCLVPHSPELSSWVPCITMLFAYRNYWWRGMPDCGGC